MWMIMTQQPRRLAGRREASKAHVATRTVDSGTSPTVLPLPASLVSQLLPASTSSHTRLVTVFDELDWPSEYFFNTTSQQLYFFYNATAGTPPPSSLQFVAPTLPVLFNITGTASKPASGISFQGLKFTAASAT